MAVKWSLQGGLIYATMLLYALALAALATRRRRAGLACYAGGFALAVAAVMVRAWHTGHAPMQNLFEVFLVLAALVFPLSMFCRHVLAVRAEATDIALGLILLIPPGFVFSAHPQAMPPALQSPLFVPHVAAYLLAYVILAKAGLLAAVRLLAGPGIAQVPAVSRDEAIRRTVRLGFPLLTAGLILGAVWGKLAWGDYWNWDPKELWSLATWLVFAGYLHAEAAGAPRRPRLNAALVLLGLACIVVTLLWVNLSRLFAGLHSYA